MRILNKIVFFLFISFVSALQAKPQIEIDLHGVSKTLEENIHHNLKALYKETDTETFEQSASSNIQQTLQALGFYEPSIQENFQIKNNILKANFQIQAGLPIRIQTIHFEFKGEKITEPTSFFLLKEGDIFNHSLYEQSKKALLTAAIQQGYLTAFFSEHSVQIDLDNHTCAITLVLVTGAQHYFGQTSFETTVLSPKLLNRYLPYSVGEIYSPEKILTLQSALSKSDYFSSVNVKALSSDLFNIPILVEVTDAKPNHYLIGGGYGTDTGVRGKVGWIRRRVNSLGHRIETNAKVSEIYTKMELDYTIPGKYPTTDFIKFNGGYFKDEYSEKPSEIYETGISEVRQISTWQRHLTLSYQHEKFNAFSTNEIIQSTLILPSIKFIQTQRDNLTSPTHGRRIEFSLRGSVDALISDTSFLQAYTQIKWLHSFNHTLKTLIRAELGFTLPDDVEKLPLSQRFFAGGDLSLRGYGYRSLPYEIDKNGDYHPVGGVYLAVGSVELVKTVKGPFGVFTFFDFGNAFRTQDNAIEMGTGMGIEWKTPLGPLKFALAKPLTKTLDSFRIHASFGPEL